MSIRILLIALVLFSFVASSENILAEDKPAEAKPADDKSIKDKPEEDKPFVTAGEIAITKKEFLAEVEKLPAKTEEAKIELLDKMLETEILYRGALKEGLDKTPEIQNITDPEERKKLFINAFVEKVIAKDITITDDEMKQYYESNKKTEFAPPARWRAPALYVHKFDRSYKDVPDEAKKEAGVIRERLLKGEDPEEIWKAYSFHESFLVQLSPKLTVTEDTKWLPEKIRESLPGMKVGDVSEVYEMKDKFCVFKVKEIIPPPRKMSFEDAKAIIQERLPKLKVNAKKRRYAKDFLKDNNFVIHDMEILK